MLNWQICTTSTLQHYEESTVRIHEHTYSSWCLLCSSALEFCFLWHDPLVLANYKVRFCYSKDISNHREDWDQPCKRSLWIRYFDLRDSLKDSCKCLANAEVDIDVLCLSLLPKWVEEVMLCFPNPEHLPAPSPVKVQLSMSSAWVVLSPFCMIGVNLSKTHWMYCMREKSIIFIVPFRSTGSHGKVCNGGLISMWSGAVQTPPPLMLCTEYTEGAPDDFWCLPADAGGDKWLQWKNSLEDILNISLTQLARPFCFNMG